MGKFDPHLEKQKEKKIHFFDYATNDITITCKEKKTLELHLVHTKVFTVG